MTRFDRITAILLQLHTRRVVKGPDLAAHFGISLRTLYRDIRSLEQAGVPIVGEAGVGYSLMDGYRLPPVHFTKEEALSLVLAGKMVDSFTDPSARQAFSAALSKITAVLAGQEKELVERIQGSVQVFNSSGGGERPPALQPLMAAIADRRLVEMAYRKYEEVPPETRTVEPIGLFQAAGSWYLIAFCRLRQGYRTFRTDRIRDLAPLPQRFAGGHPSLSEYLADTARKQDLTKIVVEVRPDVVPYLGYGRQQYGFIAERESAYGLELTFLTASLEGFARWVLMFADQARVLEPQPLQNRLRQLAEAAFRNAEAGTCLLF